MVGRSRYSLPLSPSLEQKFDALSAELDVRVLGSSGGGSGTDPRFELVRSVRPRVLDGLAFYALLPFRIARELRCVQAGCGARPGSAGGGTCRARREARARPDARDRGHPRRSRGAGSALRVAATEGARTARGRARSLRAATQRRRADDLGVHVRARSRCRCRADGGVRGVHGSRAVRRVASPLPCPERPVALFVGVLERYKAVDVLAEAWRLARPACPDATLHLVGRGTLRDVPRAARARPPGADALDGVALDRRRSHARSTRRPFSCSRRAPRGSVASSSRRSAAAVASSEAASAGSRTSSRTA